MIEFEKLGLEIEVTDKASINLDNIIKQLESLQKTSNLLSKTAEIGNNLSNQSASINNTVKSTSELSNQLRTVNENNYQASQSSLSYNNAIISNRNATISYNQALESQKQSQLTLENSILSRANAEQRLLDLQKNDSSNIERIIIAEKNLTIASNNVQKAKINEAKSTENVTKSQNTLEKSNNSLHKSKLTLEKQTNKNISTNNNYFKSISKLSAGFLSFRKLSSFLSSSIKQTANWTENLNLFAVTFGGSEYKKVLDWTTEIAKNFGFSNNELVKMTGLYKQLSTSLGLIENTGTELSKTLTKLTLDFSSFFNKQITEVQAALQSGIFAGQTKSLRFQLGIDISYQTLDNLIKTNAELSKFGFTTRQLTQDQKVLLRAIQVLTVGENAFGDMGTTLNTLQNSLRVLQGSIENLKLAIGDAMLSAPIQKFIGWLNIALNTVTEILRAFTPLKTELDRPLTDNNSLSNTNDELDELNKKVNNFSFDKFESLTSGSENENISITQALTEMLSKQQKAYDEIWEASSGINKNLQIASEKAKEFLSYLEDLGLITKDNEKNIYNFTQKMYDLGKTIIQITSFIFGLKGVLIALYSTNENIRNSINSMIPILGNLLSNYIIPFIVYVLELASSIIIWLENTELLDDALLLFGITLGLIASIKLVNFISGISKLNIGLATMAVGIGLAFAVFTNFDTMNGVEKVISIIGVLTVVLLGAALAFGAFHSAWSLGLAVAGIIAGIAAVTIAINSAKKDISKVTNSANIPMYENGGFPNKGMLIYNEGKSTEMLGSIGGRTAVANNNDIVSGIATGVREAIRNELGEVLNYIANKPTAQFPKEIKAIMSVQQATPYITAEMKRTNNY